MDSLTVLATAAVAPLAATHLVEVVHHGSIFRRLRAWARNARLDKDRPRPLRDFLGSGWLRLKLRTFFGELIHCPFCLSHWSGAIMLVLVIGTAIISPYVSLPVWWLALVRLANLINDITHPVNRSPVDLEDGTTRDS